MSKDKIEVTMNVYDIPIVVEALEEANKEIKRLNNIINKVLFILEHIEDDRVGYETCIDLLKGADKE